MVAVGDETQVGGGSCVTAGRAAVEVANSVEVFITCADGTGLVKDSSGC